MLGFIYSVFLKLFYPTSVAILLLLASALLRKRERARRICFWLAIGVLLICGNGWVVKYSTRYLERQYPPLSETIDLSSEVNGQRSMVNGPSSSPLSSQWSVVSGLPIADCIVVLGGGTVPKMPPRPTVEVTEAGSRVLYAVYLFRHGAAPQILCTAGIATGGIGPRPESETMAELFENLGVPASAIVQESSARNTHDHGTKLDPMLRDLGYKRVLLVTSAMHMPRAMGVFKRFCPGIQFIPAPTDFRVVDLEVPWYREMVNLIPTPSSYVQFSETMHEYLGMAWYRLRGWM